MTARHDVSRVPLQGAYVARRCPVRAQNEALLPAISVPLDPFAERLIDRGTQFEASVLAELAAESTAKVVCIDADGAGAVEQTLAAARSGAPIILKPHLPPDLPGRRVGRPDLLLAATGRGYRAVDIKHRRALAAEPPTASGFPAMVSPLALPFLESAAADETISAARLEKDLLQLSHYQRMLEAADLAAKDRWAAVIGSERCLAWFDLDRPAWRTPSVSEGTKLRTSMERYDFEFGFRLDIVAVGHAHRHNPAVDLLVLPVKTGECAACPWWDHCRPQLEAGPGDVSLLPGIGYTQWRVHRNHAVTNRVELAGLDLRSARIAAEGVAANRLVPQVATLPPEKPLVDLSPPPTRREASILELEGILTVGDLLTLDSKTLSYADAPMASLPNQIDLARAALGPAPIYRRRGVKTVAVPRADIEVDVDMENVEEGCYLWGCLVSGLLAEPCGSAGFSTFATWEPLNPVWETRNSLALWHWLMDLEGWCLENGHSFRAYCYNASAENRVLRAMAAMAGIEDEVSGFINSELWVDLLRVWDSQLITGHGSGLKVIAPLVGFEWPVGDPGGTESMMRYDAAVGSGADAGEARRWLVDYNRGDVEATAWLRNWLDAEANQLPSISDLDP